MGLALPYRFRGDEVLWDQNACVSHATARQTFRGGGYHRPGTFGQRGEQLLHPGQHHQPFVIFHFEIFNEAKFGGIIQVRTEGSNSFDGPTPMRQMDGVFRIKTARFSVALPAAFDGADRAHQDAVHVKKQAADLQINLHREPPLDCSVNSRPACSRRCTASGEQDSA